MLMGLCFFLSIACVSADDLNETGNFTELNDLINDADGYDINLTSDYGYVDGDEDVVISKSVTINGNNHTIDHNESAIVINANDSNVVFEEVNFLNYRFDLSNNTNMNVTFIDCSFTNPIGNYSDSSITINLYDGDYITGEISPTVRQLAQSIVGNLTDYEAAYELAVWVGKNIKHKTRAGFYQTPDMTLELRRGNCCSQADLFLQMCAAVGLDKKHKLYYVHVGTMEFGHRHFFAMIDNIVIDPDSRSSDPWGHALIEPFEFFRITPYPYLPIPREY